MLTKPDLPDQKIIASLRDEYGLDVVALNFLPLGADQHTAVYRAISTDSTAYFVKLRRDVFDQTAAVLPRFLSNQGMRQIIAPLATKGGQLWASLEDYKLVLFPFIECHNGYEADLSDSQWYELGKALKSLHTTKLPRALRRLIQPETYSTEWREKLKGFLANLEHTVLADPIAAELVDFLKTKRAETLDLIGRAERLAIPLQAQSPELVLCHSDIHAGNVLISPKGVLYIVDWDGPVLAPKERDLMFVGGGLFGNRRTPLEEETPFYRGYGQTQVNPVALAYFRYERIIQDIAVFYEEIIQSDRSLEDREQSLRYLKSNFLPGNTLEIAYRSDHMLRQG
jgi:spectinomycin phosphotransferase